MIIYLSDGKIPQRGNQRHGWDRFRRVQSAIRAQRTRAGRSGNCRDRGGCATDAESTSRTLWRRNSRESTKNTGDMSGCGKFVISAMEVGSRKSCARDVVTREEEVQSLSL